MVDFYKDWYERLISKSNEKGLLVEKIGHLLQGKSHGTCLEIGLGTSTYFSDALAPQFDFYDIVEKNPFDGAFKSNVTYIQDDFESHQFTRTYDVILASHVVYYFKDLTSAVAKIKNLLNPGGRAYFVVNGPDSDYGPIKYAFAKMIGVPYTFTYEKLRNVLVGEQLREYTTQASLSFTSPEDLYETLKLSFDLYPKEYAEHRDEVVAWLTSNVKGDRFYIDQKIIELSR